MTEINRQVTPSEPRKPNTAEQYLASSIQTLANNYAQPDENQFSVQLGHRTVNGTLQNGAWTLDCKGPTEFSRIIIAERSELDENLNPNANRDTILIGEMGTNTKGEQAYTSWKHVESIKDFELIIGIHATLSRPLE